MTNIKGVKLVIIDKDGNETSLWSCDFERQKEIAEKLSYEVDKDWFGNE